MKKENNFSELVSELNNLPRRIKAALVAFAFWTAYAFYRYSDYHSFMGHEFPRWYDNEFMYDWLAPPIIIFTIYLSIKWIFGSKKNRSHPEIEKFEREISGWPNDRSIIAMSLIRAVLQGDHALQEKYSAELTVSELKKVDNFIRAMTS